MAKNEDSITMSGVIEECLPGTKFMVRLENDHLVVGHVSGKEAGSVKQRPIFPV